MSGNNGRGKRRARVRAVVDVKGRGTHVHAEGRERNVALTGVQLKMAPGVDRGYANDAIISGRIRSSSRRTEIPGRGDEDVAARKERSDRGGQQGVWRSGETGIDDNNSLPRQPIESSCNIEGGAAGRVPAERICGVEFGAG